MKIRYNAGKMQELKAISAMELQGLALQARRDWLSVGEVSTATFYRELAARNSKSKIKDLNRNDETTTEDAEEIAIITKEFYSKLYSVHETQSSDKKAPSTRRLSEKRKAELEEWISIKELRAAIKSMSNNKAPELDRLEVELYKSISILVDTL